MKESPLFTEFVGKAKEELEFLADKPEETPESTIAALWCKAAGMPVSVEGANRSILPQLSESQCTVLYDLYKTRCSGVPLQHITERQLFVDIELLAGPEALIPRKETAILGKAALDVATRLSKEKERIAILDVCTGAGNIACLLAYHLPNAFVYASDLSPEAVGLAKKNAEFLNVQNRMEFRCGDLLKPFEEEKFYHNIDLLTCNPPYISSARVQTMNAQIKDHEPKMAFDGGPFGVKVLQALITEAPRFIAKGGWLAFETGLGQGAGMMRSLEKRGFSGVQSLCDRESNIRALLAAC